MEQLVKDGWFSEKNDLWPGQRFQLEVEKVLHHEKSDYQDVLILKTKNHGRALVLDGIIQCTEHDEFAYQEMISFLPLCAHHEPKNVLIVGGGDGGVAREVAKHPLVEKITQVEIDDAVVAASKKYLPFMSSSFNHPKLDLKICDGFKFIREHTKEFDVIITDSSDPVGPAVNLFTESYFKLLKDALSPNGIICSQAGTIWSNLVHIKQTMVHCHKFFAQVKFAMTSVPTYPTGQIGFVIGTDDTSNELKQPKQFFDVKNLKLRYYNSEIHSAAFILPNFAKDFLH